MSLVKYNQTFGDAHPSLTDIKILSRGGNFTVKTLFFFSASLKRTPFLSKRVHPFSGLYTLKITFLKRPVKQNETRLKKDSNCRQHEGRRRGTLPSPVSLLAYRHRKREGKKALIRFALL